MRTASLFAVSRNKGGSKKIIKNEELRIKNEELRIKNEELRIKNEELRMEIRN
jgi:hypothetical protein